MPHFERALESLSNSCYDFNQSPLLLCGVGRVSQFFLLIPSLVSSDLGGDTCHIFHL